MSPPSELASKLKELRQKLRLDGAEMGARLGISREWLSKIENGKADISELVQIKMHELERLHASEVNSLLGESPPPIYKTMRTGHAGREPRPPKLPTDLIPQSQVNSAQVMEYFIKALEVAEQIPGGLEYMLSHLKIHLSPAQIRKLKE